MKAKELYPGIFSRHAAAYRRRVDELASRGEARGRMAVIECIAARPGQRILDMACGPGTLTFRLGRAVSPSGEVLGVDLAQGMLDEAARGSSPRLPVRFAVMDIENLDLPDSFFDAATCGHGFQFCPNLPAALREACRVLKLDGRLGASVPVGPTSGVHAVLDRVARAYLGAPPSAEEARTRETLEDPARFGRAARDAGFSNVVVRRVDEVMTWRNVDHILGMIDSWCSYAARLESANATSRETFLTAARSALHSRFGDSPITEHRLAHVLCARK